MKFYKKIKASEEYLIFHSFVVSILKTFLILCLLVKFSLYCGRFAVPYVSFIFYKFLTIGYKVNFLDSHFQKSGRMTSYLSSFLF